MIATVDIDSFFISVYAANALTAYLTLFFLSMIVVVGVRVALMFREHPSWITFGIRICCGVLPLTACLILVLMLYSAPLAEFGWAWAPSEVALSILGGVCLGTVIAYPLGRVIEPRVIEILHHRTRSAGIRDQKTDIRHVERQFLERPTINLHHEFRQAMDRQAVYLGHDRAGEAVTIDRPTWKTSHVQIMGPPGTGKGIQAAVTLAQSLLYGDAVFVFDPKDDEWAPSVYQTACDRAGLPFEFVDLRQPQPQINPILHASSEEVEEALYAGFELRRQGNVADFYRLDDRKAARLAASFMTDTPLTLAEIGSKAKSVADNQLMTGGKAFFAALDEISELKCVQTRSGLDLSRSIEQGGCVYIVGSMRNEPVVTLQKILFVRLIQLIESSRDRKRHCSIFLDEFKYLLSSPALNALGSIRDKGCNILLAHQSLGDFANCGKELSEASVRSTVLDTTPIKWLYRPADYETASWISNQTGEIVVSTQTRDTERNIELSESLSPSRSIGESTRNLIDVNTVQAMPKGCAVCIGAGLSKLAFTEAIKAKKVTPRIVPAEMATDPGVDLLTRNVESVDESEEIVIFPPIDWDEPSQDLILNYLFSEIWTHISMIVELLPKLNMTQIRAVLDELSTAKMIRSIEVSFLENSASEIWGITSYGMTRMQEKLGMSDSRRAFTKRSINPTSVNHKLDLQRIRIQAERGGWRDWTKSSSSDHIVRRGYAYPDAVATRPDGMKVAIEIERTIKSKKRYPRIMASHLYSRKLGKWDRIYYMCPTVQIKSRLERIFSEVAEVAVSGSIVKMTDSHREPFQIFTYDEDWI